MTLNSSLRKLQENISTQHPLPSWSALQTHANLISNNLQSISAQLAEHQQTLAATQAFPLPQFPGRQQGFILETLLRTKLEPNVEEWLDQGQHVFNDETTKDRLSTQERNELWQWAPSAANSQARKQKWGADYTLAEIQNGIENVNTGLKRELIEPPDDADEDEDDYDEGSDEEDEDDNDKMDIEQARPGVATSSGVSQQKPAGPQMPVETIHRFMTTGRVG